jgi:hypothetical protein
MAEQYGRAPIKSTEAFFVSELGEKQKVSEAKWNDEYFTTPLSDHEQLVFTKEERIEQTAQLDLLSNVMEKVARDISAQIRPLIRCPRNPGLANAIVVLMESVMRNKMLIDHLQEQVDETKMLIVNLHNADIMTMDAMMHHIKRRGHQEIYWRTLGFLEDITGINEISPTHGKLSNWLRLCKISNFHVPKEVAKRGNSPWQTLRYVAMKMTVERVFDLDISELNAFMLCQKINIAKAEHVINEMLEQVDGLNNGRESAWVKFDPDELARFAVREYGSRPRVSPEFLDKLSGPGPTIQEQYSFLKNTRIPELKDLFENPPTIQTVVEEAIPEDFSPPEFKQNYDSELVDLISNYVSKEDWIRLAKDPSLVFSIQPQKTQEDVVRIVQRWMAQLKEQSKYGALPGVNLDDETIVAILFAVAVAWQMFWSFKLTNPLLRNVGGWQKMLVQLLLMSVTLASIAIPLYEWGFISNSGWKQPFVNYLQESHNQNLVTSFIKLLDILPSPTSGQNNEYAEYITNTFNSTHVTTAVQFVSPMLPSIVEGNAYIPIVYALKGLLSFSDWTLVGLPNAIIKFVSTVNLVFFSWFLGYTTLEQYWKLITPPPADQPALPPPPPPTGFTDWVYVSWTTFEKRATDKAKDVLSAMMPAFVVAGGAATLAVSNYIVKVIGNSKLYGLFEWLYKQYMRLVLQFVRPAQLVREYVADSSSFEAFSQEVYLTGFFLTGSDVKNAGDPRKRFELPDKPTDAITLFISNLATMMRRNALTFGLATAVQFLDESLGKNILSIALRYSLLSKIVGGQQVMPIDVYTAMHELWMIGNTNVTTYIIAKIYERMKIEESDPLPYLKDTADFLRAAWPVTNTALQSNSFNTANTGPSRLIEAANDINLILASRAETDELLHQRNLVFKYLMINGFFSRELSKSTKGQSMTFQAARYYKEQYKIRGTSQPAAGFLLRTSLVTRLLKSTTATRVVDVKLDRGTGRATVETNNLASNDNCCVYLASLPSWSDLLDYFNKRSSVTTDWLRRILLFLAICWWRNETYPMNGDFFYYLVNGTEISIEGEKVTKQTVVARMNEFKANYNMKTFEPFATLLNGLTGSPDKMIEDLLEPKTQKMKNNLANIAFSFVEEPAFFKQLTDYETYQRASTFLPFNPTWSAASALDTLPSEFLVVRTDGFNTFFDPTKTFIKTDSLNREITNTKMMKAVYDTLAVQANLIAKKYKTTLVYADKKKVLAGVGTIPSTNYSNPQERITKAMLLCNENYYYTNNTLCSFLFHLFNSMLQDGISQDMIQQINSEEVAEFADSNFFTAKDKNIGKLNSLVNREDRTGNFIMNILVRNFMHPTPRPKHIYLTSAIDITAPNDINQQLYEQNKQYASDTILDTTSSNGAIIPQSQLVLVGMSMEPIDF